MSLQIWLPLDGDTRNLGLCNTSLTTSNVTFADGGKIGAKYLSGGSITIPAAASAKIFNGSHMTFAFWLYPIGDSGSGQVMGQSAMGAGNNRMYTIFQYNSPTKLHLSWQSETSNTTFLGYGGTEIFDANKWTHLCITYNGTKALIYKNGEYFGQAVGTSTRTAFNYDFPIYGSTIRKLNDVRIYDHVLSEKEVKEIAKGLILHYKFDKESSYQDINLLNNSSTFGAGFGHGNGTIVSETLFNKAVLKGDNTSGTNYKDFCSYGGISVSSGETYTLSYWAKADVSGTNIINYFYNNTSGLVQVSNIRSSTGLNKGGTDGNASITFTDQWEHYWVTYYFGQVGDTANKTILFRLPAGKGPVYISNVKLIKNNNIIYDESGYGNDGIVYGLPGLDYNSIRYNGNFQWPVQTAANIYVTTPTMKLPGDQITMSIWFKWNGNSGGSGYHIVFATDASYEISIPSNGKARCGLSIAGSRKIGDYGASGLLSDGKWHLITQTYDGAKKITYVDGNIVDESSYIGSLDTSKMFYFGKYGASSNYWANNCSMSDARLYTTALTKEAVQELYETSASIDNNGNTYARELVEQ